MPVAIITGASLGFGRSLASELAEEGWSLIIDGRRPRPLADVTDLLQGLGADVRPIAGDVADPTHRAALTAAAVELGRLDLLVNNASTLGPSPLPALEDIAVEELRRIYEVNVIAPLALAQIALPLLRRSHGTLVMVSSDAAVEAYEGWGGYGSAKAALDHASRVLADEQPEVHVYQFDPGDMRTDMHQAAFPGQDISDRPLPEESVPPLRRLLASQAPSGRYRAEDFEPGMTALLEPPPRLTYDLPPALEASEPPEARGLTRDAVRMLVATVHDGSLVPSSFSFLPRFLEAGDVVVINTSGTMPAAVDAVAGTTRLVVHLSTRLDDGRWVVEPRRVSGEATERWVGPLPARHMLLEGGASLTLEDPYGDGGRLWVATLRVDQPVLRWLTVHGRAIRYSYVERAWPIETYQNVYVTEPGSAEMPSAGRPFTPEVITRLVAKGVMVTPVVLHTGVASLGADELPYPERVRVPESTAEAVNAAHRRGQRVLAVGTTVVRALETSVGPDGQAHAYRGWTDLVVTPERGVRITDGLLTGWHEPESSHLLMLEAIAGIDLLRASYAKGLAEGYRWHEFGDVHLILP